MKMPIRILTVTLLLLFTACEKEEVPVPPYQRGAVETGSIFMGNYYSDQVWYSLEENTETGRNRITNWDIALEGAPEGWQVFLNGARMMTAWKSHNADISTATDTTGFGANKKAEIAAEFFNSTAIGNWRDNPNAVYLLDLGYSETGIAMGLVWMQIIFTDEHQYQIRTRLFNTSEVITYVIPKNSDHHLIHFSILQGTTAETAPPDNAWDLVFTKYTFQFDDPPMDYLVTGVLLNPHNTLAAAISDKPFSEITAEDTLQYPLKKQPDIIGYDWKIYDFDLGQYAVDHNRSYIIRTQTGFLYKIRFINYYDENGAVGTPMFEKKII